MKFMLRLMLGLGPTLIAFADPAEPVPAETVVARVLAYSLRLKSASQEVRAADAALTQTGAQGWPTVSAEARAARYTGLKETALSPTMRIPEIPERYRAAIGMAQPVYTGGRISSQKQQAALRREAARRALAGTESDVTLEALTAYWSWSKAFYSLKTLQAAEQRMEAHVRDMKNLHEAGLATDNDALATEVLLERTRLRLSEAVRAETLARARLEFLTGAALPPGALPEAAPPIKLPAPLSEPELVEVAITNRPELQATQLDARAAQLAVRAAKAGNRPTLLLLAQYEQARPNSLIFPPEDEWKDDAFAGVVLTWDVFDSGLTRGRVLEAAARAAQAELHRQQVEDQIALEVREARASLQNAIQRVGVAERVEESATRNLQSSKDLWQNGLARHADVLDAHAQLTDAEYELAAARADAVLADAAYRHALGILKVDNMP